MPVYNLYKPIGITPLEALTALKIEKKISGSLTYAGRLDPMAEGVLLLLSGAHIKQKEKYLALPKTYEATVLFGFSTDTYDLLGLAKSFPKIVEKKKITQALWSFVGKPLLTVPAYSSVPVKGKPSFVWAREGKTKEQKRVMEIHSLSNIWFTKISKTLVVKYLEINIKKVNGDFRQERILKYWHKILQKTKEKSFTQVSFKVRCASGTYMRSIAHELGQRAGGGAVLFSLNRATVGRFTTKGSIVLK